MAGILDQNCGPSNAGVMAHRWKNAWADLCNRNYSEAEEQDLVQQLLCKLHHTLSKSIKISKEEDEEEENKTTW